MTLSTEYSFAATFGATTLNVLELEAFSMDADRTPYVSATLRIADPGDTVWNSIDPRATPAPYLNLRITTSGYNTETGAAFGSTFPDTAPMKLWILDADRDLLSGEATLALSSGEFLLDDKINATSTRTNTGATKLSELVTYALAQVGQVVTSFTGTTDTAYPVFDERRYWGPGETAADLIETELNSVGSRLWCDELGAYRVDGRDSLYPPILRTLTDWFGIRQNRSRTGRWADSAVMLYEYTDSGGVAVHTYQNSTSGSRGIFQQLERPKPATNAAQQLADRSDARGEQYTVQAAPGFFLRPGDALQIFGHTPICRIRAIDWQLADGIMTILMET